MTQQPMLVCTLTGRIYVSTKYKELPDGRMAKLKGKDFL